MQQQQSDQLADALKNLADAFAHHSMGGFFHFAKTTELSPSQIGALLHISHHGSLGIMNIGGEMSMTGAGASQMIERLVQQGFVERHEDPEDRRSKRISLTERGERTIRESQAARQLWIADLASRFSDEETGLVLDAMRILTTRMNEIEEPARDPTCEADKENKGR